jgi:hypothetical protein
MCDEALGVTIFMSLQKLFARDVPAPDAEPFRLTGRQGRMQVSSNVVEITQFNEIEGNVQSPKSESAKHENTSPMVRPNGRSGRVRTRLLPEGEQCGSNNRSEGFDTMRSGRVRRPVGWLVIIEGPGIGDWFALESGLTHIGRGAVQDVCLDFGDQTISLLNHAYITYDIAQHRFQISHGEGINWVRLNGVTVEVKADLSHGDRITIGKTTLRIAAFCDDHFSWAPILDKGGSK